MSTTVVHSGRRSFYLPYEKITVIPGILTKNNTGIKIERKLIGIFRDGEIERQIEKLAYEKKFLYITTPIELMAQKFPCTHQFQITMNPLCAPIGVEILVKPIPASESREIRIDTMSGKIMGFQKGNYVFVPAFKKKPAGYKAMVRLSAPLTIQLKTVNIISDHIGDFQPEFPN